MDTLLIVLSAVNLAGLLTLLYAQHKTVVSVQRAILIVQKSAAKADELIVSCLPQEQQEKFGSSVLEYLRGLDNT